jgi:hypothetical protein
MNTILSDVVALDSNEYIFGIKRIASHPESIELIQDHLPKLKVHMPLQVHKELQRNLTREELAEVLAKGQDQVSFTVDFAPGTSEIVEKYRGLGLKKGDALIAAQLEHAGVRWLISENRHFLSEVAGLPFQVLSAAQAIDLLESGGTA